ncbi:MAG: type IV pilus modification protein PilV [Rhodoferax sp.]|nr:type IV pilus modification protein PilV [Rhodoferax sp.]
MKSTFRSISSQRGSSLIEVLVTLVILMLGLLGLVGLMVQSQRSQMESYQRMQALVVLQDMVNRINTNRKAAACYALPDPVGTGYAVPATGTLAVTSTCPVVTAEQIAWAQRTDQDIREWNNLLLGSTEKSGTRDVGAMLGARGCITAVSAGVYQVSVVWQGGGATIAPPVAVTCGFELYGDEALRRAVSVPLEIANLS